MQLQKQRIEHWLRPAGLKGMMANARLLDIRMFSGKDDALEAARGPSRLEVACGRCRASFTSRHPRWTKLSF